MAAPPSMVQLSDLPTELLHSIFTYLSLYGELQTAMQVCQRWKTIAGDVLECREEVFMNRIIENQVTFNTAGCPFISIPARSDHACCLQGRYLYTFGGFKNEGQAYNDLWRVDLISRRVSRVQTSSKGRVPSPRGYAFLLPYEDNTLILCGGIIEIKTPFAPSIYKSATDEIFKFDIRSRTWRLMRSNQVVRSQPEQAMYDCCIVGQYLFTCYKMKEEGVVSCQLLYTDLHEPTSSSLVPGGPFKASEMKLFSLSGHHLLVLTNSFDKKECEASLLDVRDLGVRRKIMISNNDKCLPNPCQACKVGNHIIIFYPKEGTLLINAQQRVSATKYGPRSTTGCPHCTQAIHAAWKGRCIFQDSDRLGISIQTAILDAGSAIDDGILTWLNSDIEFSGSTYPSRGQTYFRPFQAIPGTSEVLILGWKPCKRDCKHPCTIDVLR